MCDGEIVKNFCKLFTYAGIYVIIICVIKDTVPPAAKRYMNEISSMCVHRYTKKKGSV